MRKPPSLKRQIVCAAALLTVAFAAAPRARANDLSGLPDYKPQQTVSGTLRSSGNDHMAPLMKQWQAGFKTFHPNIRFADTLKGSATGVYGLEMRTADIAVMGRAINPFERYGTYERSWTYPVEVEVATGSARTLGASPAFAIFVNKENPLAKLTLKQLDGIFGAQRGGGWRALSWIEAAARPASDNIRNWGQLGVQGSWSGKPIHVYGPPNLGPGAVSYFQARVLHGGAMWNEDLREYADRRKMISDLSNDRYGIAYAPLAYRTAGVKLVALAETATSPYVALTPRSVADRSYPLSRPVYIDYTIDNERSEIATPRVDPKVREFLRYVLSRQGQEQVARDGAYLPLPAAVAKQQLNVLDSRGVPPEKLLLGE